MRETDEWEEACDDLGSNEHVCCACDDAITSLASYH